MIYKLAAIQNSDYMFEGRIQNCSVAEDSLWSSASALSTSRWRRSTKYYLETVTQSIKKHAEMDMHMLQRGICQVIRIVKVKIGRENSNPAGSRLSDTRWTPRRRHFHFAYTKWIAAYFGGRCGCLEVENLNVDLVIQLRKCWKGKLPYAENGWALKLSHFWSATLEVCNSSLPPDL